MSHGKIREHKTCLNCGHMVEERFCPHCGQENVEPKQPFHYLFTHFIEDFTHYDGQFWKTIKYLLLRPGKLTKEYLAGKRQLYVAPVKLYIFISFITFFLPSLLSSSEEEKDSKKTYTSQEIEEEEKKKEQIAQFADSLKQELKKEQFNREKITNKDLKITEINGNDIEIDTFGETKDGKMSILGAENMKQFDSLYAKNPQDRNVFNFMKPFAKKIFYMQEQGLNNDQLLNRFQETFVHTLPKALFIYLPIFAFFLWIFHNKKKWWFFDHGIFTLHYFSFLLLGMLLLICFDKVADFLPDFSVLNFLIISIYIVAILYMSAYFFVAHHRVYESSRGMSIFKGIFLFIVNFIGLLIMLIILASVSFLMMH